MSPISDRLAGGKTLSGHRRVRWQQLPRGTRRHQHRSAGGQQHGLRHLRGAGFHLGLSPYLNSAGEDIALTWWGDAKNRTAKPTLDYCLKAVPWICEQYGGDPRQVILAGFFAGCDRLQLSRPAQQPGASCGGRSFLTAITTASPPGRIPARIATRRVHG